MFSLNPPQRDVIFTAKGSVIRVQYSDYEMEDLANLVLEEHRLTPGVQTPIGTRPLGGAQCV